MPLTASRALTDSDVRSPDRLLTALTSESVRIQPQAAHSHQFKLMSDYPVLVEIQLLGVSLSSALTYPDGTTVQFDSPIEQLGYRRLLIENPTPGAYSLKLVARAGGSYRILLGQLSPDSLSIPAERLMSEANRRFSDSDRDSLSIAAKAYRDAADQWKEIGHPVGQAEALYSSAVVNQRLGQTDNALQEMDIALGIWLAADDRAGVANAFNQRGLFFWSRRQYDQALESFQQALALREKIDDLNGQARTLNNIGLVHHAENRLDLAQGFYRQALEFVEDNSDPELRATILNNLGGIHNVQGQAAKSLPFFEQALSLLEGLGKTRLEARTLNNIGAANRAMGRYQQAISSYAAALTKVRSYHDTRTEGTLLNSLGFIQISLGELEKAETFLTQALNARRLSKHSRGEAITLANLGRVSYLRSEPAQALDFYQQALAVRERIGDKTGTAVVLSHIAELHLAAGRTDLASTMLQQTLPLRESGRDRRGFARTKRLQGQTLLDQNQLDQALLTSQEALALFNALDDISGQANTLPVLAEIYRRQGDTRTALDVLNQALELIESLRFNIDPYGSQAAFFANKRPIYEAVIDLLMDLHGESSGGAYSAQALNVRERASARSFLDLMARTDVRLNDIESGELGQLRRDASQQLNAAVNRRLSLLSRSSNPELVDQLDQDISTFELQLSAIESQIRQRHPDSLQLLSPSPLTTEQIQQMLDADTALIEYWLGGRHSYLWLVTESDLQVFVLPNRTQIEAAAEDLYGRLQQLTLGGNTTDLSAAALSRLILPPKLLQTLTAGRFDKLLVAADGALHYIPFSVLPVAADQQGSGSERLLQRFEITQLPSMSVVALQRGAGLESRVAGNGLAVIADPVFDGHDPRVASVPESPGVLSMTAEFPRLIASRQEARQIAALIEGQPLFQALDFDANLATLQKNEISHYRWVHLATHGIFDTQRPELSALVLSQVDSDGQPRDGLVRLNDIYNLKLNAELVVLSGCRTALGQHVEGEGLVGLTRGFIWAGAKRVIASLWQVQEQPTVALMTSLYRAMLQQGIAPPAALRLAQLQMMESPHWRDPFYWAAFVHQGDWL